MAVTRPGQLWLVVCFRDLALHAIGRGVHAGSDGPEAVYEVAGGQLRIVAANAAAGRAGVTEAITVSAALALTTELALYERSVEAESEYLEALADWAGRVTPNVSLQPQEGLLLEVRASLQLFGGLDGIRGLLAAEWRRRGLEARTGIAQTPLAALWLARRGVQPLPQGQSLAARLAGLPLTVTGWPEAARKRLREMGVRTIGECLRLPRDGFARRVGQDCLTELDRAMGRQPDPRLWHRRPGRIVRELELAHETDDRAVITAVLGSAIDAIALELRRAQAEIRQLEIELHCLRSAPELVRLEFVDPLHAAEHLLAPLLVRLESIRLTGEVTAIRLETGPLLPLCMQTGSLLDDPRERRAALEAGAVLVECLRSRFGRQGVCGLELRAEHRPELAFGRLTENLLRRPAAASSQPWPECARPLWLLPDPVRLSHDVVSAMSRLDSEPVPERIESGWWDGSDVQRDYYVVMTAAGECWWVYRDRRTRDWHLHGVFG